MWPLRRGWVSLLAGMFALFGGPIGETRAAEKNKWAREFSVGLFEVHGDANIARLDQLAPIIHDCSNDIQRLLGIELLEKVHVVVFSTESEYLRYLAHYFPNIPVRRAFYIQDRGPGMLFAHWHPKWESDLRHEITHAILNQQNYKPPLWLDEGIAEYFEIPGQAQSSENPYLPLAAELTSQRQLQTLENLSRKQTLEVFVERDYADSWAWVHFMLHRSPETRQLLKQHLIRQHPSALALAAHSPIGPPRLQAELSKLFPDLESEIADHFRSLAQIADVGNHRPQHDCD